MEFGLAGRKRGRQGSRYTIGQGNELEGSTGKAHRGKHEGTAAAPEIQGAKGESSLGVGTKKKKKTRQAPGCKDLP